MLLTMSLFKTDSNSGGKYFELKFGRVNLFSGLITLCCFMYWFLIESILFKAIKSISSLIFKSYFK